MSGYRAKKRLGQNFLKSNDIIDKIIAEINPQPSDIIIEIGAGRGALTLPLVESKANLIAVEYDRDLIGYLKKLLFKYKNVELVQGDFLDYTPSVSNYKLVGNLPYNITSPVVEWAVKNHDDLTECYLMMQKEMADRLGSYSGTKDWSPLAIMTNMYFDIEKLFDISSKHFKPQPKVSSTLVKLTPKKIKIDTDIILFEKVVRCSFNQRRKTLLNNLVPELIDSHETAKTVFQTLGVSANVRAEQLTINQFLKLTDLLIEYKILSNK